MAIDLLDLNYNPKVIRTIAVGSCSDQRRPMYHWKSINNKNPDLLILTGDNVYGDFKDENAFELIEAYSKLESNDDFKYLAKHVPIVATWDDHDYGLNDGGVLWKHKLVSKKLFLDFFDIPLDDIRRKRQGIYKEYILEKNKRKIQIILLDTRTFRSPVLKIKSSAIVGQGKYAPDKEINKTILGSAQWRWLEEKLRIPVDIRLLISSIQVISDVHGWEKWGNFPYERERILNLLLKSKSKAVIIISGDRHIGSIYSYGGLNGGILYELTSSALNRSIFGVRESDQNRIGKIVDKDNFGLIEIEWHKREIKLSLNEVKENDTGGVLLEKIIHMKP